jgi:short-subunit dehydrogenase
MNPSGKRVLLTGATGGIGGSIARALAARGATLVLTGRRVDVLEPLAAEIGGTAIAADLSDAADVDRLLDEAGEIDILVANAALPGSGPLLEYTVDEIDRAVLVNLRAPMILARALGERMVARGAGHLVFVSSLSGKAASPGASVYAATKFGIRGFALCLREDLIGTGVGVSLVSPGFVSGAGMFEDTGIKLPPFVGSSPVEDVSAGVIKAIEANKPEVVVAPLAMRAGSALAGMFPGPINAVQRRLGANKIADAMGDKQRVKR